MGLVLSKLTHKSTGKRPLERNRRRCEDNIKMSLKEIGSNTRKWVDLAQVRDYWKAFLNAKLNLRVPLVIDLVIIIQGTSLGQTMIFKVIFANHRISFLMHFALSIIREKSSE